MADGQLPWFESRYHRIFHSTHNLLPTDQQLQILIQKGLRIGKQSFFHNLLMIPLHVNCFMTPVTEVYIHDSWKSKRLKERQLYQRFKRYMYGLFLNHADQLAKNYNSACVWRVSEILAHA